MIKIEETTRTDYSDPESKKEIDDLKKQGVKCFYCTTYLDGKPLTPVIKQTAQGISAYANKMYRKYNDKYSDIKVDVEYMDKDFNIKPYTTYG